MKIQENTNFVISQKIIDDFAWETKHPFFISKLNLSLSIRCLHFATVHQVSPFLVVWILAEVCNISDKYYFCNNLTQNTWFPSLFSKKSCFCPSQKPLETFKAEISNQDQLNTGETVMTLSRNLLIGILIHFTGKEI